MYAYYAHIQLKSSKLWDRLTPPHISNLHSFLLSPHQITFFLNFYHICILNSPSSLGSFKFYHLKQFEVTIPSKFGAMLSDD